MRRVAWGTAVLLALTAGCSATPPPNVAPTVAPTATPTGPASTAVSTAASRAASPTAADSAGSADSPADGPSATPRPPRLGTTAPAWLGSRPLPRTASGYGEIRPTPRQLRRRAFTLPDTVPALPGRGFASRTEVAPSEVIARSTWRPGCPVAATDLSWVRLTFRGFDDRRHTGELLVNASVAADVVEVFHRLWRARFPIEEMQISTRADLDAEPTGDGNDTEAFACRPSVGATSFSQHAYGLAIDVDPFQNPYSRGLRPRVPPNSKADRLVLPELASAYLDRTDVRPGMITPDGPVVSAFAAIGWTWGGTWRSLLDLQHFSQNGR